MKIATDPAKEKEIGKETTTATEEVRETGTVMSTGKETTIEAEKEMVNVIESDQDLLDVSSYSLPSLACSLTLISTFLDYQSS